MTEERPLPDLHDPRLVAVVDRLRSGDFAVLSLDIFDTLLWRSVPEPSDAFPLIGASLAEHGLLPDGLSPEEFAVLRAAAEEKARSLRKKPAVPEVTLEEIYQQLAHVFRYSSAADLAEHEVQYERSITFPDVQIAALARTAHQLGLRVVLVSDTYFTADQLRTLTDRPELADLDPGVYASCEWRRGKGHGLFAMVVNDLGVAPARILHVGDHPHSDVAAAANAGLEVAHYHKYPGDLARILDREVGVREGHIYRAKVRPTTLDGGDFGLTALRSKAGWLVPPAIAANESLVPYWQFGASVVGHLFASFGAWVVERAEAYGAETIHCMMREGEFLARIINGAAQHVDAGIKAEPLWISRRVCAEAIVEYGNKDELYAFLARRRAPKVEDFVAALGLELDAVKGASELRARRMDDHEIAETVIEAVAGDAEMRHAVIAVAAARRQRLVAHLRRSIHPSGTEIFVDLGWGATIQTMMKRALEIEGISVDAVGLYLVTTDSAVERVLDGNRCEGFLAGVGHPATIGRWVTRSPEALEQICMSSSGSLIGFTELGETVHAEIDANDSQREQREAVQDGAASFQELWQAYSPRLPKPLQRHADAPRNYLRASLLRFVVEPVPSEASLFASWLHDENFGSDRAEGMVAEELSTMASHMTPTQFLDLPMTRVYWPFAMAALWNPPLSMAAATVAADIAPAGAFASTHVIPVVVEVDAGAGFVNARTIEVRLNVNGLCFARTEFLRSARAVRVFLGDAPAVVRLDAVRLVWTLTDGSTHELHASGPAQFGTVDVVRGIRLADNLVFGVDGAPVVVFELPDDLPPAYRVELEVAFAHLPTPLLRARPELMAEIAGKALRSVKRRVTRSLPRAET